MIRRVLFLVAVVVAMVSAGPVIAADPPRNVILFGWDGAQREHVHQCLERGELPTLKGLIDAGVMVDIDIEGRTDTKAGWSQILTGYYPDKTGVYSNSRFQPVPAGYSIFERLESLYGPDNFVTVAVIGKKAHCGAIDPPQKIRLDEQGNPVAKPKKAAQNKSTTGKPDPGAGKQQGAIIEEDGVKYRIIPGQPYHNMYKVMDVWEYGLAQDAKVGTRAMELLEQYKDKPFLFFVHFAEVDHSGHQHGENSSQYNDALISNDLWTGRIMRKVKDLGLADKTQFYITADHGFNEDAKGHGWAPYVFLATNNKQVARNGRRQDVAPTILEAFGVDPAVCEPPLDGISLTRPDHRGQLKLTPPKRLADAATKVETPVKTTPDVVYVPTPQEVVDRMLELVQPKKDELLYDLGCGDGRIVVTAAIKYGSRAVGYDIDPRRIADSNKNVADHNVGHLVTIEQQDIFTLDLSQANVVTLYLLPQLNVKLIPQLQKLKPGSRIISHDFDMRGVKPDKVERFTSSDGEEHTLYLWTAPIQRDPAEAGHTGD